MSPKVRAYVVLALGVSIVAWAAILIRWAGSDAPPPAMVAAGRTLLGWLEGAGLAGSEKPSSLAIAAGRMGFAALLLTPVALAGGVPRTLRTLRRPNLLLLLASGLALALHFASWIASLSLTTVASSVVLVTANPLFVALASHLILHERVSRLTVAGIALAVVGGLLIGYGDIALSGQALLGDLLALLGALMASTYFLLGRSLRRRLPILAYIWPVYTAAALALILLCLLSGLPLAGYTPESYLLLLLLALGPQLLGHSALNYALGHLSATLVAVAVLGEPLGATVLALALLGEVPPATSLFGGALLLGGILLAGRGERPAPPGDGEQAGRE
ncbi:MAG: DMT family transporter [Chloroflexia bacterium]